MNVHSIALAAALVAGCATEATAPGDLDGRLAEPTVLTVTTAHLGVTVLDSRHDVVSGLAPQIEGGSLVVDAVDGRLRVLAFELDLSDIEVPAEVTGLHAPLHFTDVRITMPDAPALATDQQLQLEWSLVGTNGPAPLAPQLVRAQVALSLDLDDAGALRASLHLQRVGAVWHFGELSLHDLDITVAGAEL